MIKTHLWLIFSMAVFLLCMGAWIFFGPGQQPTQAAAETQQFLVAGHRVSVSLQNAEAGVLQPAVFTVEVKDPQGVPIQGAAVELALSMPGMFCGISRSQLSETGKPGVYAGPGIPLMAGAGAADVTITSGGEPLQVRYAYTARR